MSDRKRKKTMPLAPAIPAEPSSLDTSAVDAALLGDLLQSPPEAGPRSASDVELPAAETAAPRVLAHVGGEPHDSSLQVGSQPESAVRSEDQGSEPLALPRGAWMAMRRSGGFHFRSREIAVYRSGKSVYIDSTGKRVTRQLSDAQIEDLNQALAMVNFAKLPAPGRQNPDAFAYELVARVGRRARSYEAMQGSIPESLAPLIESLNQIMAQAANSQA